MITNLTIRYFPHEGKHVYKATYSIPNLFETKLKEYNVISSIRLSEEKIRKILNDYHLEKLKPNEN